MPDLIKAAPKKPERFKPAEVVKAIEAAGGVISQVARNLKTHRATVYAYRDRYPEVRQALEDARQTMIDEAESALRVAAARGEGWAVCFTLKCLAKDRGYVERGELQISGPGGGPIQTSTIDVSKLSTETLRKVLEELKEGANG